MASVTSSGLKTDYRGVDLSRKRFYNTDFSGQDLSRLKLRHSLFYQSNFDEASLSEADCEGSEFIGSTLRNTICYRSNFKDAKLAGSIFEPRDCFGITLTLQCSTFSQMRTNQMWWYGYLFLATLMRPDRVPVQEDLINNLIAMIGAERYVKLKALFGKREM